MMAKSKPIEVDILDMEMSQNLPHWLSPIEQSKGTHDDARRQAQIDHAHELQAEQRKARKKKQWDRTKARAVAHLAKGQNDLYRGWHEDDHPRAPAGGPDGGQFTSDGGGGSSDSRQPDAAGAEAVAQPAGRLPRAFNRESPSDAQRERGVVGVYRPTPGAEAKIRAAGDTPQTFYEFNKDGAKGFHNAIGRAKADSAYGAAVHVYEPDEYAGMRLFTSPDGMSGFALKGDDIVSLFKHPDSKAKGVADVSLKLATEQGGRRLDAFDTVLPKTYSDSGFKTVARLKWNEEYKPSGWDKETFKTFNGGEPDVVFMVHDPAAAKLYVKGEGPTVKEYDDGTAAQLSALGTSPSPSPFAKDPTSASSLLRIEHDVTPASLTAKIPGADAQIAEARAKLKAGVPTDALVSAGGHKLPDGSWTPERMAIHRDITDQIMTPAAIAAAQPEPGAQPVLHILGGRGGSGKGWFTKTGTVDTETSLYLNSDDVKEKLPEYQGWNAALLHEESSHIGDAMEQAALAAKLNVIIDATLKSGATTEKRINAFKAAGYRIEGHYMYASPVRAAEQATGRFVRGNEKNGKGRFVPPEYSMGSLTNEHSFDQHRDDMDDWEVYDNMGGTPKLHSRKP